MAFGGDVYTLPGNKKIKQHNKKKPDRYAESTERHTIHVTEWKKTRHLCRKRTTNGRRETAVFIFWREFLQNRRREKSSSELRKRLRLMMVSDF